MPFNLVRIYLVDTGYEPVYFFIVLVVIFPVGFFSSFPLFAVASKYEDPCVIDKNQRDLSNCTTKCISVWGYLGLTSLCCD